jgi:hypothetical protein
MNAATPIEPDKASSTRFRAVHDEDIGWQVVDTQCGVGPLFRVAVCPQKNAERIAYALNTLGRLLGDPAKPYMIEDVERLAAALDQIATTSTSRAMQALGMGETATSQMFGAEGRAIGAGADMLKRMLAELLKFALVGDSLNAQAEAWLDGYNPERDEPGFQAEHLLDAFKAGRIGHMSAGVDMIVERVCRDVAELPDRDGESEGWPLPGALVVMPEELALIVRRALGEDV